MFICLVSLFLMILNSVNAKSSDYPKCCCETCAMTSANVSYTCDRNSRSDLVVVNQRTDHSKTSFCIDLLSNELYLFEKVHERFEIVDQVHAEIYSKCCPVGFVYNEYLHSCVLTQVEQTTNFRFLRVGLFRCLVILDYTYKIEDFPADFVLSTDYCIDDTLNNKKVIRICWNDLKLCESKRCVHKCCPDNQSFVNGSNCSFTYTYGVDLNFSDSIKEPTGDFIVVHGYSGNIYLQPADWSFELDTKGVFTLYDEEFGNAVYYPTEETYCIEYATKHGSHLGYKLFRILPEKCEMLEPKYVVNGYVMIVSDVFLMMTIFLYFITKQTKKRFGKTLVSFCGTLGCTLGILILSTFQLDAIKSELQLCQLAGFLLLYGEFSTFLWLELLCFDIYYTFGSGKIRNKNITKQDTTRFMCYCLYGWGVSLFLTLIPLVFYFLKIMPSSLEIKMGVTRCFIERYEGNYAEVLFRTIPITFINLVNLVLFAKTVKCCMDVKKEIAKMNNSHCSKKKKFLANKQKFTLIIKLTVVMGMSYLFEVVSSFYDFSQNNFTKYVELVWDIFNCMQGIFIFFIFAWKGSVWQKIKSNLKLKKLGQISLSLRSTRTSSGKKKDISGDA